MFKHSHDRPQILVGKDTRISGDMLEHALVAGICSTGGDALLAGSLPTPGVSYVTSSMGLDAGVIISASHNPFTDNGIKIFRGDGFKLSDEMEYEIERLVLEDTIIEPSEREQILGTSRVLTDAPRRYITFLKEQVSDERALDGLNIVLDCSNGATFEVGPSTFRELGATVHSLFSDPDGTNINLHCGSEYPETLAAEVAKRGADIGFAFDGDGDRVTAVDETGGVLTGGQILVICAKVMRDEHRLGNNLVVSTVMSNIGLGLACKELGIGLVTTQVGDKYVLQEMLARGASVGGEDSGHMIFLDHHNTGDGILTALMLVRAMQKEGKRLSELSKLMKVFPQRLINVEVKSKPPIEEIPDIVHAVRRVEEILGERGRVLVRYSGTQPMCRVMVEGPTHEETELYCREIAQVVTHKLG
jgi:phosphoglucosamine mutase